MLYTCLDLQQKEEGAVHVYLGEVWTLNRRKRLQFIFTWEKFGTGGRGCCSYLPGRILDPKQEEGVAAHIFS